MTSKIGSGLNLKSIWLFILPIALPLYVIRFNIGPIPTTLLEIFVLVSFSIWLAGKLKTQNAKLVTPDPALRVTSYKLQVTSYKLQVTRNWFLPILAWLIVTLVAVFIAPDKWAALGHWRAFMLEPVLVFVMLSDLLPSYPNPNIGGRGLRSEGLLFGIATVTILLGIYSIFQYLTGFGTPHPWDALPGRRATGVFGFPNGLSLFMAPFGIACLIKWLKRGDGDVLGSGWVFLCAFILAGIAEVLAKSMGGLLALGIGGILALLINKNTRKIGFMISALGLIVSAVVGYKILSTQLRSTNLDESLLLNKKWSSMVRTVIWSESWQLIKVHPLAGTGLRSYSTAIIPFHKATWMEIYPHPHNIILMLWIETGLLGLLAFIWICVTWTRSIPHPSPSLAKQERDDLSPAAVGERRRGVSESDTGWLWLIPLIVILAHGMVDLPYFKNDLAIQFWILAALASL